MEKQMKIRMLFAAAIAVGLVGCQTPKPKITDDTIETSQVNGVTLTHRHIVVPPTEFTPINTAYRALYSAAVMNRPGYGGKAVSYTHLTLPTKSDECRSRWSPYH